MIDEPAAAFVSARWKHLVMLNYEVDPAVLHPYVPAGTELDTYGERHFASMVGFRFLDTRVRGFAVPLHGDFEEVNLRFYVRRDAADGLRRGVVFIKEIVPRRAVTWVANLLYNESYITLPMSHDDRIGDDGGSVTYGWRHEGSECELGASVDGSPYAPAADSLESFIAEHYWGYARQRDGSTAEYRVEHPPWLLWRARQPVLRCDAAALYGPELAPWLARPPSSAFVAVGSEVRVRRAVRMPAASDSRQA